jgi:hypothetical protein
MFRRARKKSDAITYPPADPKPPKHVVVLVLPLAGGAGELAAFENETGHLGGPCVISFTSRSSAPGDEPHAEKDFGSNEEQTYAYEPH